MLAFGTILGFVNAFLLGAGADVWGKGTLMSGIVAIAMIVPVFIFRHFIQDKAFFPPTCWLTLRLMAGGSASARRGCSPSYAGGWSFTVAIAYVIFWT